MNARLNELEMVNMALFDGGRIEDIRSLARISGRQSYSECLKWDVSV